MNRRTMITSIAAIAAAGVAVPALGLSPDAMPFLDQEPPTSPAWRRPDELDNSAVPHQNGHHVIDVWAGLCIGRQLNLRRKANGLPLFAEDESAVHISSGVFGMGTPLVFNFLNFSIGSRRYAATRGSLTEQALNEVREEIISHECLFRREAIGSGYELVPRGLWVQYIRENDEPKYDPANFVVWDLDLWKKGTSANGYLLTQHYHLRRIPV